MNCPQPQPLSQCVSENAVPITAGDTWGQFEYKTFISKRICRQLLNSRARVGTGRTKVSPLVPTIVGTGLGPSRINVIRAKLFSRGVGVNVWVDDKTLLLKPKAALDDDLLARVRAHKPDIAAAMSGRPAALGATPARRTRGTRRSRKTDRIRGDSGTPCRRSVSISAIGTKRPGQHRNRDRAVISASRL